MEEICLGEIPQTRIKFGFRRSFFNKLELLKGFLTIINSLMHIQVFTTWQNAQEQEVLRLWQGLGYYSRARNLHTCAKQVVENYEGVFPDSYIELLNLKGVGKYTASAIASFAFDENKAVVDGNVFRVLSRYFGIEDDIADAKTFKIFEQLADDLVKGNNAADFNQGIMDFGAIQCTPKSPEVVVSVLFLKRVMLTIQIANTSCLSNPKR